MANKNQKRIAIVTGGASGIGLAIAQQFIENDIFTIIIGRDAKKLRIAQKKFGELCEAISFDLSEVNKIPALLNLIFEKHGKIDILVNNAGVNLKKDFCEVSDEEFQNILLINVTSVFAMSRETVKYMLQQQEGVIINISSMAAQYGIPKVIAYSASKSAIDGLTKAMAVELSGKGIRVNAIAPGFIATKMSAKALNDDPERKQRVLARTPMGHLGAPEDVGKTAVFLTSDAAKYITGIILPVDGGNSIGF